MKIPSNNPISALLVGVCWCLVVGASAGQPATDSFLHNGATAHRGNSGEFPENTLAAFQSGIDTGADWLELDVLRTKDGKLVVIHDETTERVGDKNLVVAESTYEQLLAVDVAADFRQRNNKSIETVPKHTIPLLEEALRLVMAQQEDQSLHSAKDGLCGRCHRPRAEIGSGEMGRVQRRQSSVHVAGQAIGPGNTGFLGPW